MESPFHANTRTTPPCCVPTHSIPQKAGTRPKTSATPMMYIVVHRPSSLLAGTVASKSFAWLQTSTILRCVISKLAILRMFDTRSSSSTFTLMYGAVFRFLQSWLGSHAQRQMLRDASASDLSGYCAFPATSLQNAQLSSTMTADHGTIC